MVDLDAIRGDIEMATRSAEMARHVALDHAPELLTEIERLTPREITTVEELELLPVGSVVYQSVSPLYGPRPGFAAIRGGNAMAIRSPVGLSSFSRRPPTATR